MVKVDLRKLYKPFEQQAKAHTAPERYVLYGGAIRGGKTVWLVNEALQLSLECPGNVGWLCRQELTVFRRTTQKTFETFVPSEIIAQHHKTENWYKLVNGSMIYYGGLGDDDQGLRVLKSMELGWFGIDQAEEISESLFEFLMGRLALVLPNIRYKGLLTANPTPGWVKHRFIEQKLYNHIFIPGLPKDNPFLPVGYEDELRKQYPDELVKQLLEGDWDTVEAGNFLFKYGNIKKAVGRKFEAEEGEPLKMGVDIAAGGEDVSVATIRWGNTVTWIEAWSYSNTMATTGRIINIMERFKVNPGDVNVDAIGIGKPVYDRLVEQGYGVNGVVVGEAAQDKEHYTNIKAESYFQLAKRFEDGLISIPDEDNLMTQLSTIRFDTQSDKRMFVVSKKIMKDKYKVKSPDYADSLMLAFTETPSREVRVRWL